MRPLITVLVHLHREWHLVCPALRSAVLAAQEAARHGVGCRLVAVIDRGDEETRVQVSCFRSQLDAVYDVDFGDLARARNFGIAHVDTTYFALLDGDDLLDRDWPWKGVCYLEELGDERAVAHAAVRMSFGAEYSGRIQFSTDSPLFNPLNLIASWHYAADVIARTDLYRRLPFVPWDMDHNLGAEDWLWTCESIVEGIRHVIVPETAYFYRRQLRYVGLGGLRGFTFRPTRLLEPARVPALDAAYPSAAIRFADRATRPEGERQRWASMPPWLETSVERACELDLAIRDLHPSHRAVYLTTPPLFPAVGHFYLNVMAQLGEDHARIVFICDRLAPENLALLEDFLAAHRQRKAPALDVLIVALGPTSDGSARAAPALGDSAAGPDAPWLRLRHVDLGAEPSFARLAWPEQCSLLVRLVLQARPALVVNLDSVFFDSLIASWGPAVASGGTRTVRVSRARHAVDGSDGPLADWRNLICAEGRYSLALCRNAEVAEHLNAFFHGSGLHAVAADREMESNDGQSMGATLRGWLDVVPGAADAGKDSTGGPALPPAARPAREPDVTVVVSTRCEGYYLNPMLRALAATVSDAAEHGLCTEIVIATGRPGPRTHSILMSLARRWPEARVVETDLSDQGAIFNAGLAAARGRYLAVMPAAELVSPGWLARAVCRCQEAGADAIVHPHAVVECGAALRIGYQPDMESAACDLAHLAFHETWTAHALASRELFQRLPYRGMPAGCGYGHATWHWNCETVAQGCRHLTVPDTAVYRRAAGSLGESIPTLGRPEFLTLPPSRFFSARAWLRQGVAEGRALDIPAQWDELAYLNANPDVARAVGTGAYSSGYAHYRLHGRREGRVAVDKTGLAAARQPPPADWDDARYLGMYPDVAQKVAAGVWRSGYAHYCLFGRRESRAAAWTATAALGGPAAPARAPREQRLPTIPAWLRRRLSARSPCLDRFLEAASGAPSHAAPPLSRVLDQEMRTLAEMDPGLKPESVGAPVVVPPGDLWAANVYRAGWRTVAEARPTHIILAPALRPGGAERSMALCLDAILENPDNRPLVITTDSQDHPGRDRLPSRCTWLPFPTPAQAPDEERMEVLMRLLVNAGARTLHLFHSQLGWQALQCHAPALAERMRLFVSIFCVPPVTTGVNAGYAQHLGPLLPHLAGILLDNQGTATMLQELYGVPRARLAVLRHPAAAAPRFAGPSANSRLVLWAGRLDMDKRPDLLRAIAERLPALRFHVYGTPVLDDDSELRRLRAVPNIDYRGPFSGFDSIATAPYHCFLYTSRCDGQPNVLLEAMQSGLLVVASDVGAVAEVVGDETGVLVRPADEPAAYAEAIGRTLRDGQTWRRVAANGQRHVAANFTTAAFRETLRTLPGYLA